VVRKEFLRVGEAAEAAEESLRCLRIALHDLDPSVTRWLEKLEFVEKASLSIVTRDTPYFYALASVGRKARMEAAALRRKDKGGAPQMYPFTMLILSLVLAFEAATERKARVTYDPVRKRYKGDFFRFVEKVLPLAPECAAQLGQNFPHPQTHEQRGRYVHEWTRSKSRRRTPGA
jgi:hypothetical protein